MELPPFALRATPAGRLRTALALIEIGLVTKDSKGSVLVPFSRIRTEFDLRPKQAA